jgi:GMP synthase-like glutamine amidotransferase
MVDRVPVLGVCYGAQLTAKRFGGRVEKSNKREYGRALLHKKKDDVLLHDVMEKSQVWMSHADTILELPEGFELLATTESIQTELTTHHSPLTTFLSTVYNFIPKYIIVSRVKKYCTTF